MEFGRWFGSNLDGEFVVGKPTFTVAINEAVIFEHQRKNGFAPSKVKLPGKSFVFCTAERRRLGARAYLDMISVGWDRTIENLKDTVEDPSGTTGRHS